LSSLADLHVHSSHSDGTDSPAHIFREAERIGLGAIGLTDHDTVSGIPEAVAAAADAGVEIVPAIELSGYTGAREIHIVGLFIDWTHAGLIARLEQLKHDRERRMVQMVARLCGLDVDISPEEVLDLAAGAPPSRMHLAEVIRSRGYAESINDAFVRYIGDNGPAFVSKPFMTPEEAIQLVRTAGGVPVMAHPGLTRRDEDIPQLVRAGLAGIEAYSPAHPAEVVEHYVRLAEKHGLVVSGGSDYHGTRKPDICLGTSAVSMDRLEEIRRGAVTSNQ